jgi:hypothetical protein
MSIFLQININLKCFFFLSGQMRVFPAELPSVQLALLTLQRRLEVRPSRRLDRAHRVRRRLPQHQGRLKVRTVCNI